MRAPAHATSYSHVAEVKRCRTNLTVTHILATPPIAHPSNSDPRTIRIECVAIRNATLLFCQTQAQSHATSGRRLLGKRWGRHIAPQRLRLSLPYSDSDSRPSCDIATALSRAAFLHRCFVTDVRCIWRNLLNKHCASDSASFSAIVSPSEPCGRAAHRYPTTATRSTPRHSAFLVQRAAGVVGATVSSDHFMVSGTQKQKANLHVHVLYARLDLTNKYVTSMPFPQTDVEQPHFLLPWILGVWRSTQKKRSL